MSDEVIVCADCRSEFTFTASEATFFASKGLTKPRRCKTCRQKRRDAKATATGAAPGPTLVPDAKPRGPQWVGGGGEVEDSRRGKGRKDRRRDRHSDDHSF